MKLLYVVHSFPPFHWRGTEIYTMELATAMTARGHEPHVFHLRDDPDASAVTIEHDTFQGIPVHRARMRIDPSDPETYFFNPSQEKAWKELVNGLGPEVVHFLYFTGGLSLGLPVAAREAGARVFMTVTDFSGFCPRGQMLDNDGERCPGPKEGVRCAPCLFDTTVFARSHRIDRVLREYLPLWLMPARPGPEIDLVRKRLDAVRKAFAAARLVIFPNNNTRRLYRLAGFGAETEKVMDYGIDTTPFQHHRKSKSPVPRIGFIGQLLPHKGLDVLVKALEGMPLKHKLIVHGSLDDPGAREYFESIPQAEGRVEYRATFPFEKMNRVLEGLDLLVVPSNWDENCPLIVKYAIATGTMAVLADQPGMVADRVPLDRVEFFKPGDAGDLRRALIRALARVKEEDGQTGPPDSALAKALESGAIIEIRDQAMALEELYGNLQ